MLPGPVGMNFRQVRLCRRMTVNDHLLERLGVLKEFFSYPSEIVRVLFVERNARPNARVHETEIANNDLVDCSIQ